LIHFYKRHTDKDVVGTDKQHGVAEQEGGFCGQLCFSQLRQAES